MQNIDAILSSAAIGKPLHNKQHEDTVTQLGPPLSLYSALKGRGE